ncbi:sugar ABC transporter ATP-binding protein [Ochrobactrum sp. Q0168]|uniref:sugar ABC transporter ATP-binding protein n=1 Tax=Ochrobactrum sp. Q0168 TaxID=2793241 RepID=UPI0018EBFE39|nr:sugar ABC transporter ATP-binding protein [Ochrobactrum sp. Q0168]
MDPTITKAAEEAFAGFPTVSAHNLQKSFDGRMVLRDISLKVKPGEIRAVLGNNGSGKSTLIKILTGAYTFEEGEVVYGNQRFKGKVPAEALDEHGVRVIHQESPLPAELTVAEIFGLRNGFPKRMGIIDWKTLRRRTNEMLSAAGASLPTDALVSSLDAAERATLALLTALHNANPRGMTIILDETTAALSSSEANRFLQIVRNLAEEGAAVITITHRLGEVMDFADSVDVMRDGAFAYSSKVSETNEKKILAELNPGSAVNRSDVHGREIDRRFIPCSSSADSGPILTVKHVTANRLAGASLELFRGEVVGIPISVGNGASDLLRSIAGAIPVTSGEFSLDGKVFPSGHTPATAIERNLAFLPGDRLKEGGIAQLSVRENMAMPRFDSYWLNSQSQIDNEELVFKALAVSPPDASLPFGVLSGGNKQKVLLGKWLLMQPKVILLDDPTVGVDPASRETIFEILRGLATKGAAVLLTSTEPALLARVCDRVLIMNEGTITTEFGNGDVSYERISREFNR